MKAMLATSEIPDIYTQVKYPAWVSPKLDGIRCLMVNGVAMSRNNKPLPNPHIQQCLAGLNGFDGEIMLLDDEGQYKHGCFNEVQSKVMSKQPGRFKFAYVVFDYFGDLKLPFHERNAMAMAECKLSNNVALRHLTHWTVNDPEALKDIMKNWLEMGYEGLIIRSRTAPYKQGRATMKQGWMQKYKLFKEDEGIILLVEELMHNGDTSTKMLENQIPGDTFGSFLVSWKGKTFGLGSGKGLTQQKRKELWTQRKELIGKKVNFSYQELSKKGIPRFPTFNHIREDE